MTCPLCLDGCRAAGVAEKLVDSIEEAGQPLLQNARGTLQVRAAGQAAGHAPCAHGSRPAQHTHATWTPAPTPQRIGAGPTAAHRGAAPCHPPPPPPSWPADAAGGRREAAGKQRRRRCQLRQAAVHLRRRGFLRRAGEHQQPVRPHLQQVRNGATQGRGAAADIWTHLDPSGPTPGGGGVVAHRCNQAGDGGGAGLGTLGCRLHACPTPAPAGRAPPWDHSMQPSWRQRCRIWRRISTGRPRRPRPAWARRRGGGWRRAGRRWRVPTAPWQPWSSARSARHRSLQHPCRPRRPRAPAQQPLGRRPAPPAARRLRVLPATRPVAQPVTPLVTQAQTRRRRQRQRQLPARKLRSSCSWCRRGCTPCTRRPCVRWPKQRPAIWTPAWAMPAACPRPPGQHGGPWPALPLWALHGC